MRDNETVLQSGEAKHEQGGQLSVLNEAEGSLRGKEPLLANAASKRPLERFDFFFLRNPYSLLHSCL